MPDGAAIRQVVFEPGPLQLKSAGPRRGRPRINWAGAVRQHAVRTADGERREDTPQARQVWAATAPLLVHEGQPRSVLPDRAVSPRCRRGVVANGCYLLAASPARAEANRYLAAVGKSTGCNVHADIMFFIDTRVPSDAHLGGAHWVAHMMRGRRDAESTHPKVLGPLTKEPGRNV